MASLAQPTLRLVTRISAGERFMPRRLPTWSRAVALLALAAFTILSFAGHGNVLCFADDGHVAIEPRGAHHSGGTSSQADVLAENDTSDAAAAGQSQDNNQAPVAKCVDIGADIQVRHDSAQRSAPLPRLVATLQVFSLICVATAPLPNTQHADRESPPNPPPTLTALRTFVLVI